MISSKREAEDQTTLFRILIGGIIFLFTLLYNESTSVPSKWWLYTCSKSKQKNGWRTGGLHMVEFCARKNTFASWLESIKDPTRVFPRRWDLTNNVFYDEVRGSSRYKSHPDLMIPFELWAKQNAVLIRIGIPPLIIVHGWSFWLALQAHSSPVATFASDIISKAGLNMRTEDKAQGPLLGLPLYLQRWHNPCTDVYMN